MMKNIQLAWFWPGLLSLLLTACTTAPSALNEAQQNLVWPQPPATARIGFVRTFSRPEDLGIRKGFFERIGELFIGSTESRLIRPMAVAVSDKDVVYVADPGVRGVHRFDTAAGQYNVIRRIDDKPLPSPVALTRGTQQDVLLVDSELAQIFRIKKNAKYATPIVLAAELKQPTGISVNVKTGRIYVVDTGAHQLKIFNRDGSLYKTVGRRGTEPGEFNFPTYVWTDNAGRLLVTDSLNFRVQILDSEGAFIRMFGKSGDGSGNMSRPKGVAMDRYGHIYVVDGLFHSLQIFDEDGRLLLPVGQRGQEAGEFWLPTGIFLEDNGNIYIADSHNRRVQVFRYLAGST